MLVERFARDPVRKPLHDERPVGDGRPQIGRDARVEAEQLAFRDAERRPEDLLQVADGNAHTVVELEDAPPARLLERAELGDDRLHQLSLGIRRRRVRAAGRLAHDRLGGPVVAKAGVDGMP